MQNLIAIDQLSPADIQQLFDLTRRILTGNVPQFTGYTCAYSFEGNSLRTRVTVLKALARLGITAIELPNLLKTKEPKHHLAGYLDHWVDLYIIRDSNHDVLSTFAHASTKPVINAMTSQGHPCEILGDAFWLEQHFGDLGSLKYCIVGERGNVLHSWLQLCAGLKLDYQWVTPQPDATPFMATSDLAAGISGANVILTDSWGADFNDLAYQVTLEKLQLAAPNAVLIPCPPFTEGAEVSAEAIASPYFAGYAQKRYLYEVQMAIITTLLT